MWTHDSSLIDKIMWESSDSRPRQKIQERINRQLFNYLSALFGFIEFHRTHNLSFLKTNENIHLRAGLLNSFKDDPTHKFIQDVRNYVIHNKHLSIASELSFKREWDTSRRNIYVKKDDLLEWYGWTLISRSFIEAQENRIYLFDILKNHFSNFIKHQLQVFRLLLMVSPETTIQLREHLEKMFHRSGIIGATGSLPFNRGFLRYINHQISKVKHNA